MIKIFSVNHDIFISTSDKKRCHLSQNKHICTFLETIIRVYGVIVSSQVWRSVWMEQSHHLCAQHPEWTPVDWTLRGNHYQKHKEQCLPLQTYICQGKTHCQLSARLSETYWPGLIVKRTDSQKLMQCFSFRETTGVLMWMRSKDLWWIRREKWSTGFLENGMRAFTVVFHLLPNVFGGQVDIDSHRDIT